MCSPYHSFQMIKSLHFSLLDLILCTNNKFIEDSFIYLFFQVGKYIYVSTITMLPIESNR